MTRGSASRVWQPWGVDFPEVPSRVERAVRRICSTLPEIVEKATDFGTTFAIRRRVFAHLFAMEDPDGRQPTMLVIRADPIERLALLAAGHPFFRTASSEDRVGVVLEDGTDWTEIEELVTESYRLTAPKQLAAQLDTPAPG